MNEHSPCSVMGLESGVSLVLISHYFCCLSTTFFSWPFYRDSLMTEDNHQQVSLTVSFLDPVVVHASCKGRCYEPFDEEIQGCRCDQQCNATNSCCYDFQDICLNPSELSFMSADDDKHSNIICLSPINSTEGKDNFLRWQGYSEILPTVQYLSDQLLSWAQCCYQQ